MINEILVYCKMAGWISIFLFFITMSVFIWALRDVPGQSTQAISHTNKILNDLDVTLYNTNQSLAIINRPCPTDKTPDAALAPCGTLADVAKTLNTTRGTLFQIEVAAHHEDANLSKLDNQEEILFSDIHSTLTTSTTFLNAGTNSLNSFNTTLGAINTNLPNTMIEATGTFNRFNRAMDDPHLAILMSNLASTTTHIDGIASDAQVKAHQLLNPDKQKVTKSTIWWGTLKSVHELLPPIF